jgi:hypothetical protein
MCPFHASPMGALPLNRLLSRQICGSIAEVATGAEVLVVLHSSFWSNEIYVLLLNTSFI